MIRLGLFGAILLVLTLLGLSLHTPGALTLGALENKNLFVAIAGVALAVYLLAVVLAVKRPAVRHGVWVVLLVAAAIRIPLIVSTPFLSTDVFRYVWDGRVQAAGINPYRYIPDEPELKGLRDKAVFPHINRAEWAPTIYPPAAQLIFAVSGFVWSSVTGIKAIMVGFEILAAFCLLRLLKLAGQPLERILIYAWNPLPIWAFAGNGHIDAAAAGFVALALLLRVLKRDGWAGAALGLAIATKFLPMVVAPVLWRARAGWRTAAACVAVVVAVYAIYSSVGPLVFGFLGGYGAEEGYDTGAGFWLLAGLGRIMTLPAAAATVYKLAAMAVLAALGGWFAFVRRPDDAVAICGAAGVMMAVATWAVSPHYPWYFAWLAVPCVLAPTPAVLWLSAAPVLLYLDTFGDRFVWPSVIYVPAILLALLGHYRPRLALAAEPIKGTI